MFTFSSLVSFQRKTALKKAQTETKTKKQPPPATTTASRRRRRIVLKTDDDYFESEEEEAEEEESDDSDDDFLVEKEASPKKKKKKIPTVSKTRQSSAPAASRGRKGRVQVDDAPNRNFLSHKRILYHFTLLTSFQTRFLLL